MAPIGLKLGEHAFQTIPDVSFFDVDVDLDVDVMQMMLMMLMNRMGAPAPSWKPLHNVDVRLLAASHDHA